MLNIFNPILDTFNDIRSNNIKYLYNGVTIDEATRSTDEIVEFAVQSTKGLVNSYDKARKLYDDVINMLEYDEEKSNDILNWEFVLTMRAFILYLQKVYSCQLVLWLVKDTMELVG